MSDPKATKSGRSSADILNTLARDLPQYLNLLNEQVAPQARTELGVAKEISPQYQQLMSDLYKQYGPELARTASDVENISRTGSAQTDVDILRGPGRTLVTEATALDKVLNPEYYKTREAAAGKLGELLSSINLNRPDIEAERQIGQESARTGNIATPSATSTVANALQFGEAANRRRAVLSNAINTATNFLQPSQSAFNPIVTALGRSSGPAGQSNFLGITNPGQTAYNLGQGFSGNIFGLKQQQLDINAQRRDALDRFNETLGAVSGASPNISV